MARTRSNKHSVRQDWNNPTPEVLRQPEECQVPAIGIGDANSNMTTRLMGLGVNVVECLPTGSDEIRIGTPEATTRPSSPKGLGTIAPHLFNLEPRSRSERPLRIDFDLYQMEKP